MKKTFILSLLITLFVLSGNAFAAANNNYFYNQLSKQEQNIYDNIAEMERMGELKNGNTDHKITNAGFELQNEITGVTLGNSSALLNSFTRAKDAYQYDNPSLFYVDFDNLSIRVGQESNGTINCYIGTGRTDNYYNSQFKNKNEVDSAITTYNNKLNSIISGLPKEIDSSFDDKSLIQTQLRYLHDQVVNNMIYKFESQTKKGSARTAYDGLINNEGVCEAYTRSFKALCDKAGIPNITVYGMYKNGKNLEEHIWNYVQIDDTGNWYAVDATQDDPIKYLVTGKRDPNEGLKSGKESYEYFLVGSSKTAVSHVPSGVLSSSNYKEFTYPQLSFDPPSTNVSLKTDSVSGDLKVKTISTTYSEDKDAFPTTTVRISFRGNGYKKSKENGYYFLMRASGPNAVNANDGSGYTGWYYISAELFPALNDSTVVDPDLGGTFLELSMPQIEVAQFAVTTQPSYYDQIQSGKIKESDLTNEQKLNMFFYVGEPDQFISESEPVVNPFEVYQAPPYPTNVTPSFGGVLMVYEGYSPVYNMQVSFDQKLVPDEGKNLSIEVTSLNALSNTFSSDAQIRQRISISNPTYDANTNTISWSFKPSIYFADMSNYYYFQIHGMVGEKSKKEPIQLSWGVSCEPPCSIRARQMGVDSVMYGSPALMDDVNLDYNEAFARDSDTGKTDSLASLLESSGVNVRDRLALISYTPNLGEQNELLETLKSSDQNKDLGLSGDISSNKNKIDFYQINLNYCKKTIYQTGQKIRICFGFPEGVSYDSAVKGLTGLKVYHYVTDPETGSLTGKVEEIPVTITPQGLIIIVDSFSPFAIVQTGQVQPSQTKSIILSSTDGGKIDAVQGSGTFAKDNRDGSNVLTQINLEPNQSYTFKVTPDYNKAIEEITTYGYDPSSTTGVSEIQLPYLKSSEPEYVTLRYEDLPQGNIILAAKFVDQTTLAKETNRGETSNFSHGAVKLPNNVIQNPGKILTINAIVDVASDSSTKLTYVWEKIDSNNNKTVVSDSSDAVDNSDSTLTITKATYGDSGVYTLTVSDGKTSYTSNPCTVNIGYEITFDSNNGSGEVQQRLTTFDNTLDETPILPNNGNSKFAGWFTSKTGGTEVNGDTVFNKNTTVYAHWTTVNNGFTVSLDPNGGTVGGMYDISTISTDNSGKLLVQLPLPQKDNSLFLGWFLNRTGGQPIDQNYTFTKNTTLYAHWQTTYTITLDPNGGTLANNILTTNASGKIDSLPVPTRANGYACLGWFTQPSGGVKVTVDTVISSNMTLYAHWEKVSNGYTITLDTNGGSLEGHTTLLTLDNGKLPALPTPVRENYNFAGWFTAANNGTKITTDTVFNSNSTIYAHWSNKSDSGSDQPGDKEDPNNNELTVTISSETIQGEVKGAGTYNKGEVALVEAIPTSNYIFGGWKLDGELITNANPLPIVVTSNLNLEPVFVKNSSEIPSFDSYEIKGSGTNEKEGSILGLGNYKKGIEVTLLAKPASGFLFENWKISSNTNLTENPYTFTPSDNVQVQAIFSPIDNTSDSQETVVYRIYNRISGEHIYTKEPSEVTVRVSEGDWDYEGAAWYSPNQGTPIYRLFNPVLGNHLYTTDLNEVRVLTTQDIWVKDFNGEPCFYSGGSQPVMRLYNRDLRGDHLLTTDMNEYNTLPSYGWQQESVSFYVLRKGK